MLVLLIKGIGVETSTVHLAIFCRKGLIVGMRFWKKGTSDGDHFRWWPSLTFPLPSKVYFWDLYSGIQCDLKTLFQVLICTSKQSSELTLQSGQLQYFSGSVLTSRGIYICARTKSETDRSEASHIGQRAKSHHAQTYKLVKDDFQVCCIAENAQIVAEILLTSLPMLNLTTRLSNSFRQREQQFRWRLRALDSLQYMYLDGPP